MLVERPPGSKPPPVVDRIGHPRKHQRAPRRVTDHPMLVVAFGIAVGASARRHLHRRSPLVVVRAQADLGEPLAATTRASGRSARAASGSMLSIAWACPSNMSQISRAAPGSRGSEPAVCIPQRVERRLATRLHLGLRHAQLGFERRLPGRLVVGAHHVPCESLPGVALTLPPVLERAQAATAWAGRNGSARRSIAVWRNVTSRRIYAGVSGARRSSTSACRVRRTAPQARRPAGAHRNRDPGPGSRPAPRGRAAGPRTPSG